MLIAELLKRKKMNKFLKNIHSVYKRDLLDEIMLKAYK